MTVDFVLLHPDGRITEHARDGLSIYHAVRAQIVVGDVQRVGTMGLDTVRVWYDDDFALYDAPPNELADRFMRGIGYQCEPGHWRGVLAISMEEGPDEVIEPIPDAILANIEQVAGYRRAPDR
ncbi:hypothetical protein [Nocardia nova]|uniref:hypothetical protein n=1 Tax=Nocardia nova TaxID=37330 RepID=UPI0033ECD586